MKAMKGLSVNRVIGTIKRRTGTAGNGGNSSITPEAVPDLQSGESPEVVAARSVKLFCESGGPGSKHGDEVLFLPPIVEASESSPAAASECARVIRKYLSRDYMTKPSWQYNAIMLMRILTDNPGPTFTRNLDKKFVDTTKELLRAAKDPSLRQMLMETLDTFEQTKFDDEGLTLLIEMWKREKERAYKTFGHRMPPQPLQPRTLHAPPPDPHNQNYFARNHTNRKLPSPIELAGRLEEARTSAKLLSQVVVNTPPQEILNNELIREFADRCQSASRSIQLYMVAENPSPDNDTMESLIDTNEQLQTALNQHQRAVLGARKQLGIGQLSGENSPVASPLLGSGENDTTHSRPPPRPAPGKASSSGSIPAPPLPARVSPSNAGTGYGNNGKGKETDTFAPPPMPPPKRPEAQQDADSRGNNGSNAAEDPFQDPQPDATPPRSNRNGKARATDDSDYDAEPRLAFEPYSPGFGGSAQSDRARQDSAIGKVAMHGAAVPPSPLESHPVRVQAASGSNRDRRYEEDDDDEDLYESTPKRKEPANRY